MHNFQNSRFALLGLLALIGLVYLFRGLLVVPPPVDADHAFNTERAFERLERILGDERPHPVDSDANDLIRERLLAEIEALGFSPSVGDEFHCKQTRRRGICARLRNVAFWVTDPGPNAILIASHYDSVPAGPGASDDGAGVAASLEIASLLKGETLARPVLVLITDGEEIGLMGADQFVRSDPRAQMVGTVVNMEARGVAGLSALIQTSRPNGRDLAALKRTTRLPAASSLNADIYELLPNDTDMTEFLELDIDAANLAYAGRPSLYHTPGDNLANLDKRSLFNMGASGLAATQAFLAQSGDEAEAQLLYVDVLGHMVLKMPVWLGGLVLALSLLATLGLIWREAMGLRQALKFLVVPILALLAGTLLAVLATMLVDAVRTDRFFGAAYPVALRGLHVFAALTGALIPYTFFARAGEARGLLAGSWALCAVLGGIAFCLVPGASIVFVPSAFVFLLATLALWLGRVIPGQILGVMGAFVFLLIALPLTALGETGLFIEASAPFAAIGVAAFLFLAYYVWPPEDDFLRRFWLCGLTMGGVSFAFLVASLLVPAHSADAPRGLSVTHIQGDGLEGAYYTVSGRKPVPAPMAELASFERAPLPPIYAGSVQHAQAPVFVSDGVRLDLLSDYVCEDTRTLSIKLSAPQSDRIVLVFDGETELVAARLNTEAFDPEDGLPRTYMCQGRACRNLRMEIAFAASEPAPELNLYATLFGLGAQSAPLLAARPDRATARQAGDQRIIIKTMTFDTGNDATALQ